MRQIPILLTLLAVLTACRQDGAETARAQPGQPADSELTVAADTVDAGGTGFEYEAPRLIPAMRAQLEVMGGGGAGATEGNVSGYKNAAGDLVNAMLTDLNRVGSSEVDGIRALGDSVVNLVGGGTGVPDAGAEDLARSAELMGRLIERYQAAMRASRP
jgi:hypothetical protein